MLHGCLDAVIAIDLNMKKLRQQVAQGSRCNVACALTLTSPLAVFVEHAAKVQQEGDNPMTAPKTQLDAFKDIKPSLPRKRQEVYSVIASRSEGMALFEVAKALRWPVHCVSGRITELSEAGYIEDSGKRRDNPDSGKAAIVWRRR